MHFYAPLPFPARDVALAPNGHTLTAIANREAAQKNVIFIYELGLPGARSLADTEGATVQRIRSGRRTGNLWLSSPMQN